MVWSLHVTIIRQASSLHCPHHLLKKLIEQVAPLLDLKAHSYVLGARSKCKK